MRKSRVLVALIAVSSLVVLVGYLNTSQANPERPYEIFAPFWLAGSGWKAEFILNNNEGQRVPFTVEIHDSRGTLIESGQLTAQPNQSRTIPLGDLVGNASVEAGYAVIRYDRDLAGQLPTQLVISEPDRGLSFNYLFSERRFFSTPDSGAAFWLPTQGTDLYGVFLNKSVYPIEVTLQINTRKQERGTTFLLGPGALSTLKLRDHFGLRASDVAGRFRVFHDGEPGDVITQAFAAEPKSGFSTTLQWSDAGFSSFSSTVILSHMKSGHHEAGSFTPQVVLFNESVSPIRVVPRLRVDNRGAVPLRTRVLGTKEVRVVDLSEDFNKALGARAVDTALELEHDGAPGSLVVAGLSVDRSLQHVYSSKVRHETQLQEGYSYPFRIGEGWNTKVVLVNRYAEPIEYCLFFFFQGRHYTYAGSKSLEPFEQRTIDVLELREQGVPDEFGRLIPEDVIGGQIKLLIHGEAQQVVGQAIVENIQQGISISVSCDVCPKQPVNLYLLKSSFGRFGSQARYTSVAGGPRQRIYPVIEFDDGSRKIVGAQYDPEDDSITDVDETSSGDFVEFLSPGQSEIRAQTDVCNWFPDFSSCEPMPGSLGCPCECQLTTLTVPTAFFIPSPPALVTVTSPTVILEDIKGVAKNGTKDLQVTMPQGPLNVDVTLTLATTSGFGAAQFATNNSTTLKIRKTTSVKVKGVTESSTADNIRLRATIGSNVLRTETFSVYWVTLSLRTGSNKNVSTDNKGRTSYIGLLGTSKLGVFKSTGTGNRVWRNGVEIVGQVQPPDFTGLFTMIRTLNAFRLYDDMLQVDQGSNLCDTSDSILRDDDPQSGSSVGSIYDLDAPGFNVPSSSTAGIRRRRTNYTEIACFGVKIVNGSLQCDKTASAPLFWFSRLSIRRTTSGDVILADTVGDNTAGTGPTPLTWNLQ